MITCSTNIVITSNHNYKLYTTITGVSKWFI